MSKIKRQINDIINMWCAGWTIARISSHFDCDPSVVEYVIDQYGEDVV